MSLRMLTDGLIWFVAMVSGAATMGASLAHGAVAGGLAAGLQIFFGAFTGLYRGRWRLATFDEAVALTAVISAVSIGLAGLRVGASLVGLTVAVSVLAPFFALTLMVVARGVRRVRNQRLRRRSNRFDQEPVVVFGAGDGGEQIVRAMLGNPKGTYVPVALLDDDPAKRNLRIQGVPVLGTRADLRAVTAAAGCSVFVIAIPTAGASTIRSVAEEAEKLGLDVRVLPPTQELVDGIVSLNDLREISEADLLGRRTIDTDLDAIASYLTGQRVLVTGAGGSIGSELCRQIARFAPAQLVMVDRDESALHGVQLTLEGHALLDHRNLVVADIRDAPRVAEVFEEHAPNVVFHAAALKHLPLLEMYAEEGWKTNVLGTNNVLRSAARVGVTHFVNISTDKAADPTSVLGYTKRLAEQLTSWYANRSRGDWVSVRFGNVLGSRGSMLRTFRAQVDAGGPITVTHPDVTRFFMTPQEACQLVIQAGAVGHRGEALVLDMGEPVRILDVAQRLAAAAPEPIEIEFTGLREGEKLHEDLIAREELDIRRAHPLISHVAVPALRPSQLGLFDGADNDTARESMRRLCVDSESHSTITL
ncbi:MAG: nucleoside-diphosphate sugar epimerase/dehydratase [Acidimicrobiia bacterium]|nr:nucleoside-diphosphate sugar epimerase/dehydratase [Acidimicrobiia bacterium]